MRSLEDAMKLYERREKHPRGILTLSLQMRQSLYGTETEERKKRQIRTLMCRGVLSEREYSKALPHIRAQHPRSAYRPGADYFRCYLSKATSNVMNRLTSRYKNEAARKEFYTRLAAIAEAIHLCDSHETIANLFEERPSDELIDLVLRETATLVKSDFDVDEKLKEGLEAGRRELSEFMSGVRDLTGLEWEESEKYDRRLTLVSFFDPWYSEDERTQRWGVMCYSNPTTLNISPPLMLFDAMRRSVIAREAVNLFTPRIADSVPKLYEQSEYLATKLLRDRYEGEFWLFARHGLREETKRSGISGVSDFFSYYESFVGDDLYRLIWSRLKEMTRLSLRISSLSEYGRILDAIAARPVRVKLEEREIELFKTLSIRPDMPLSQLARSINASIPTTTKIMQRLRQKACLRFFILSNDRALGLEEYLLLIKTDQPDRLPFALWSIPYCRDIYRLYGSMDYFVVVNVPTAKEGFLDKLKVTLRESSLASQIVTVVSTADYSNTSLDYWDPTESVWHVHWDSWGAGLAKALSEHQLSHEVYTLGRRVDRVKIDGLDLRIMEQMEYDCRKSYSDIGKALGISGAYVSRKASRLLRNQVFRPIMKPFKIGAEEYGLVTISCDIAYIPPIVNCLHKLPAWRGAIVTGDFNGLLAQIGVPSGELNQLFMILDDRLVKSGVAKCVFHVVGMWSSLRRWHHTSLYSKGRGWRFDEEEYLEAVSHYAK